MAALKIISLGWGVQSWTLAAMVTLGELEPVDFVIHSDTGWEREATYQFAAQWGRWLESRGVKLVTVESDVIGKSQNAWGGVYIPAHTSYPDGTPSGLLRRQCTERWKIRPVRRWLRESGYKKGVEQWLGITVDEVERAKPSRVKWITSRFPLLELGMNRNDCINWLRAHNLAIPGKSSCVFCPYHSKPVWREMKREGGNDWIVAVAVDREIRNARPNFLSYVHADRRPLSELKIAEDFGAKQLNFVDVFDVCESGYCFL